MSHELKDDAVVSRFCYEGGAAQGPGRVCCQLGQMSMVPWIREDSTGILHNCAKLAWVELEND